MSVTWPLPSLCCHLAKFIRTVTGKPDGCQVRDEHIYDFSNFHKYHDITILQLHINIPPWFLVFLSLIIENKFVLRQFRFYKLPPLRGTFSDSQSRYLKPQVAQNPRSKSSLPYICLRKFLIFIYKVDTKF